MNFYKRKQKWKYALFLLAILISALSIYLINDLENSLEKSINSLSQSIETLKNNEKAFVENEKAFLENEKAFLENEKAFVENEQTFKRNEETFKRNIEILNNNKRILEKNIITLKKEEEENIRLLGKALEHLNNMDPETEGDYSFSMEIVTKNINIPLIHVDERGYICDKKNIIIPQSIKENPEDSIKFLQKELNIMKKIGDSIIIDVAGDTQKLYYRNSTILKQTSAMNKQASIMEEQTSIMHKETERIRDETKKMQEGTKKMQDRTNAMQDRTNAMQEKTRNSQEFTNKIKKDTNDILNEMKLYPLYYTIAFLMFIILAYLIFNAARRSEQNQVWAGMAKETAHQIGTPLSSLMAWTELLKQNPENESMTIEIEKDLKRLETITERFSKIGSKSELNDEDITEIIKDSISYMEKRFSKNIQFVQKISIENKKIKLNKVLLVWVIENICNNAADAMKGEGKITINCTESNDNMHISISDTGGGIDKSIIKSIFMPGITSKERGWGLGLSLSKRIIEDYHKGKIFVKTSNEKDGTTFSINLPKS